VTRACQILSLAAAPTFAAMAFLTIIHSRDMPGMTCSAVGSAWDGMFPMYLLMSVFHVPAWLRLIDQRRIGER
jgi:hypothetical protein